MKLSISNIAWEAPNDKAAYELMKKYGYTGLEIAPTRIFSQQPYTMIEEAYEWSVQLKKKYGFSVPSMQSIWYGRQEKIFGTPEERALLIEYTKKAIDFAAAIDCKNLVFGCPKNRNLPEEANSEVAVAFFKELGDYAADRGTVIGMEANPPIYNTNYVNDTVSAIRLIREVGSKGFLLNLDIGTMIQNEESPSELCGNVALINHVHISEPGLKPLKERKLHLEVLEILKEEGYQGFISIEMGKTEDLCEVERSMRYVRKLYMER